MISQEEIEAALECIDKAEAQMYGKSPELYCKVGYAVTVAQAYRQAQARIVELEAEKKADWFVPAYSEEMALERLKQAEAKSADIEKILEDHGMDYGDIPRQIEKLFSELLDWQERHLKAEAKSAELAMIIQRIQQEEIVHMTSDGIPEDKISLGPKHDPEKFTSAILELTKLALSTEPKGEKL